MKLRLTMVVVLLIAVITGACSSSTKETIKYDGDKEIKATIKVMAFDDKRYLTELYLKLFNAKYPNIEVEFVQASNSDTFMEKAKQERPDVLFLIAEQYEQFIDEGMLYDIDPLLQNDSFQLEGVHPDIVSSLRELGNGKLYGLVPYFQNKALYYNTDLFDRYDIPYPQDGMTWDEVIELAKRFPAEEGISGLYMQDLYTLIYDMTWAEKLSLVNEKDMQMTLQTDALKSVFEKVLEPHRTGHIVLPSMDVFDINDPFLVGTSAMTMDYYYYMYHKIGGAKMKKGPDYHLNWDVVTAPVNGTNRDVGPYFYFGGMTAIYADSDNKQAAWEFVKFLNSEEFAKAKSRTIEAMPLPLARTEHIYNPEGKHMEAFYNLKPNMNQRFINYDLFPDRFFGQLTGIINSEGKAYSVGAKTLDEAIISMQERAQQLLDGKK